MSSVTTALRRPSRRLLLAGLLGLAITLAVAASASAQSEVKEVAADLDDTAIADLEAEVHDAKLPLVGRFDVASRARADESIEVVVDARDERAEGADATPDAEIERPRAAHEQQVGAKPPVNGISTRATTAM